MSYDKQSVIAIIQARVSSRRLPGKVTKTIGEKPSLFYVIERLKRANLIDKIVLATTDKAVDDPVASLGETLGIRVFRGDEDDVVGRFGRCLLSLETTYDLLVRVTGDNFLICPEVIDASIEKLVDQGLDIVNPFLRNTYPFGCGAEVVTLATFWDVEKRTASEKPNYREHLLLYCYDHSDQYRIDTLQAPEELTRPDLNISVDEEDEFRLVAGFLESLPENRRLSCTVSDIISYFDEKR